MLFEIGSGPNPRHPASETGVPRFFFDLPTPDPKKLETKNLAFCVLHLLLSEPMNRHYFRAAIYLSILVALTTLATWGVAPVTLDLPDTTLYNPIVVPIFLVSVIIPFGIWLGSNLVRYVGAILLVFWAGGLIWPLISFGITPGHLLLALLFILSACFCLATAWLLLLSRKFRTEFAEERAQQPKYKTYLRKALLYAAIAAMVIATLNDIYHLATA